MPRRRSAERRARAQSVGREQQREAEHDDQELRHEVDKRDDERPAMQARAVHEPDDRDGGDDAAADHDVPGPVHLREERPGHVVRHEERGQRNHDQVVEEEHPARGEAPEVVEGDADERRRPAGLANRSRPLRVGERDEQEEETGRAQDGRREPERVQRDDSQGEVDRGGDLAVRDREERGGVEDALQAGQLARHALRVSLGSGQGEAGEAEGDEEHADEVAEDGAPVNGRDDDERDADPDEDDAEDGDAAPVEVHAATLRPAATITRQDACFRTKSTVSLKTPPRCSARGAPMTMISLLRRTASSTIARPALRARTRRSVTFTPYSSPIATAASSASSARLSSSVASESSESSSGTTTTASAAIDARRSAARRAAKSIASSDSRPGFTGTRMLRYSTAAPGPMITGARIVSVSDARRTTRR